MDPLLLEFLLLSVLIAANGLFAMAELAVISARSLPGWLRCLRNANSRLATRQLAMPASSRRDGLGPRSCPSGAASSLSNGSSAVSSKRMRKA